MKVHEFGQKGQPTILFLHGLGVSSWMWHDQIETLKQEFHCLAIDLPGNGESYQLEWLSLASSASQVADVIRQAASNGQAHVVGLSLGGYVGLQLLADWPNVVVSMIVSGVTTKPMLRQMFVKPVAQLASILMKRPLLTKLSAKMMQLPDEVLPAYYQDMARLSATTVRRIYEEVFTYEVPLLSVEMAEKLLVVAGDKEAKAVLRGLAYFADSYPETAVLQAPNAHHGWNAEHPQLFTEMIEAWVTNQPLLEALAWVNQPKQLSVMR